MGPLGASLRNGAGIWKRVGLAGLAHVALLLAWPMLAWGYAPAYRALGQLAIGVMDPLPEHIEIRLEPGSGGPMARNLIRMDTVVSLRPKAFEGAPATFGASSFFHGYYPTTVLLALFLAATPLGWRKRKTPLLWALALLHLGLALRFLPSLFYCYADCTVDGVSPLGLGPTGLRALHRLRHLFWVDVAPNYLAPLLLFCLLALRPPADPRPGNGSRRRGAIAKSM